MVYFDSDKLFLGYTFPLKFNMAKQFTHFAIQPFTQFGPDP